MTEAGWYPDPSGEPGRERFHDGETWTTRTRPGIGRVVPLSGPAPTGGGGAWWLVVPFVVLAVAVSVFWADPAPRPTPPSTSPIALTTTPRNLRREAQRAWQATCGPRGGGSHAGAGSTLTIGDLTLARPGADWSGPEDLYLPRTTASAGYVTRTSGGLPAFVGIGRMPDGTPAQRGGGQARMAAIAVLECLEGPPYNGSRVERLSVEQPPSGPSVIVRAELRLRSDADGYDRFDVAVATFDSAQGGHYFLALVPVQARGRLAEAERSLAALTVRG